MHDISELQRRIAAALDRIGGGLQGLATPPAPPQAPDPVVGDDPSAAALRADLEAEQAVTAQLQDRLQTSRRRHLEQIATVEAGADTMRALMTAMEQDRAALKAANDALRNANQALREANAEGLGDAHLINSAALTELDALRIVRDSDRAELDGILAALMPVFASTGGDSAVQEPPDA